MRRLNPIAWCAILLLIALSLPSCQKANQNHQEAASEDILKEINTIKASLSSVKLKAGADKPLIHLPFQNPEEISSNNGILDTELAVEFTTSSIYNTVKSENISLYHRSYNGKLVGPTLRLKRGDSLFVNLVNQLPTLEGGGACDPFEPIHDGVDPNIIDSLRFNNTNLHTHGLHVSPMGHGDNVFVNLDPGCSFQNRIGIPDNHAPGTFWYHAHLHGSTAIQVSSGMGGAIIIEGGLDSQPEIEKMEEKIFIMQQIPYTPDTSAGGNPDRYAVKFIEGTTFGPGSWQDGIEASTGWRTTINGMVLPIIEMESEEAQRWRFIHAGVRETLNLKLVSLQDNKINHEKLHVVAEDGIAYGYRNDVDSMTLQPGYRADILVQATVNTSSKPDTLYLIDADSPVLDETDRTENESEKVLAVVIVKPKTSKVLARKLPTSEALAVYAPYPSLVNEPVTDSMQYVQFDIVPGDTTLFQINGEAFDHTRPPRQLGLNNVQEWTLTSSLGAHPFHIHVNHFQIQQHFKKVNDEWVEQPTSPIWKDTYFVPSSDSIIIKSIYKDFVGDFVLHCHILDHEDQGMMESVRIDKDNRITAYLRDNGISICGPSYKNDFDITELE